MKINADFKQRTVVHSADMEWLDSPMVGVTRRPLDRVGSEVARATSVVRYAPGSHFSPHVHTGGEEFFVIDGVFQDEHGDFPAGSYIRNPPESSHTPGSTQGCTILVKLWQFDPRDRTHVRLQTQSMKPISNAEQAGVAITPLYFDEREEVSLQEWHANTPVTLSALKGLEVFVISGMFMENNEVFRTHSWLRLPEGSKFNAVAGPDGAKVWIKQHHLPEVNAEISRVEKREA